MRNWWHRLWCWECRNLRPARIEFFPNDFPLYEPTLVQVRTDPFTFQWMLCPRAKARARVAERILLRTQTGTLLWEG